jgi:hypothetical protein
MATEFIPALPDNSTPRSERVEKRLKKARAEIRKSSTELRKKPAAAKHASRRSKSRRAAR